MREIASFFLTSLTVSTTKNNNNNNNNIDYIPFVVQRIWVLFILYFQQQQKNVTRNIIHTQKQIIQNNTNAFSKEESNNKIYTQLNRK